jgi:dipeptidyl aminopeptidase/acylaminoacyl peptidase
MMRRWLVAALTLTAGRAVGQAPPGTDVYLVPIKLGASKLQAGTPENVTNRPGYDNQPQFSPDGKTLFYTSVRDGQSDIYRLDLQTRRSTALTGAPESEYSATVLPGGKEFSVIRVERDSTQRLWAFPIAGGAPRLLLEKIKPVGYQAWVDPTTVGVFVLGSPSTLQVADLGTGTARILLSNIGRALHRVPGKRAFSVTQLVAENTWWIVSVDAETGAATPLIKLPEGAEYYVWLPDGSLLSAADHTLYRAHPGRDRAWSVAATLSAPGMGKLTRLAVSPRADQLAVVAEEP